MMKNLLLMMVLGCSLLACADDAPVRATYVPSECPPCEARLAQAPQPQDEEPHDEEAPIELGEPMTFDDPDALESDALASAETTGDELAVARVSLNHASTLELIDLPGVGPALASRIADYRAKRPFEKIEDLRRVRGIGEAKFEKLRPHVVVD